MRIGTYCSCGLLVLVMAGQSLAAVDLVTIPRREGTQLTIYNSDLDHPSESNS